MKMLHFNTMRKSAGNICLVLFIAFLFSIVVTPITGVDNAWAAVTPAQSVVGGSGQYSPGTAAITQPSVGAQYSLLISLAPLTPEQFNTLSIVFTNGAGASVTVYKDDMGYTTDTSVYGTVYKLVYNAPVAFTNAAVGNTVYGTVYITGQTPLDVILTLIPAVPRSTGGGGGSTVTPVPPVTPVVTTYGDIASHWAKADIELMVKLNIVKGMGNGTFAPDATITRAQFAAFLIRALGLSESKSSTATYSDVAASAWYYGVVEAAKANGLVNGYANGTFNPNGNITRQEMAVMVSRALKAAGKTTTLNAQEVQEQLAKFNDKGQIASWASESVALAADQAIVNGRTASTFVPASNATRAEGVVMIKRIMGNVGKL